MLTQKELNYIMIFKQTHLHRFREIENLCETMQKNHSNSHRKLTILGLFDILRQIN